MSPTLFSNINCGFALLKSIWFDLMFSRLVFLEKLRHKLSHVGQIDAIIVVESFWCNTFVPEIIHRQV